MSRPTGFALAALLASALLTACSGDATDAAAGTSADGTTPAATTAPTGDPGTTTTRQSVGIGTDGQVPRGLVVAAGGRASVLLAEGTDPSLTTLEGSRVVQSVHIDATTDPVDVVAARDRFGGELLAVVAERTGDTSNRSISLLAVSGGVVEERPVDPSPRPGQLPTRAAASPDGRRVYLLTAGRDQEPPTLSTVDVDTGHVVDSTLVTPPTQGPTSVDRTALAVSGEGSVWVAVSGPATADASGRTAALLRLSPDLDLLSTDRSPGSSIHALGFRDGTVIAALRQEGAAGALLVVQPTSEEGSTLRVSDDDVPATDLAASGPTVAVTHEAVDGRPTVTVGDLDPAGGDPRTSALCPSDGTASAVAAAPGGGFLVVGTCRDVPQLWSVP